MAHCARSTESGRRGLLRAAALGVAAIALVAAGQAPAMLDGLQDGLWEVRPRDGSAARRLCVKAGFELIQLRHRDSGCSRYIVDERTSEVTVQYTCRGTGYGRTTVRRESAGLVQIETQGIEREMPFQFEAEARRIGPCR